MKKLIQTRLHNPPEQIGNCYATVIACFMDLNSPEDAIQIQEIYYSEYVNWQIELINWLEKNKYRINYLDSHPKDDSFYAVTGKTIRDTTHICIYQNGMLFHDPHPSQFGLISELAFEIIEPMPYGAVNPATD